MVHRRGDSGSPIVPLSTRLFRAFNRLPFVSLRDFLPAPARRMRPSDGENLPDNSFAPAIITLREIPVASWTSLSPPRPWAFASEAAQACVPLYNRSAEMMAPSSSGYKCCVSFRTLKQAGSGKKVSPGVKTRYGNQKVNRFCPSWFEAYQMEEHGGRYGLGG